MRKLLFFAALLSMSLSWNLANAGFILTTSLTGDPRPGNPDELIVDITIDVMDDMANWEIDINSPEHPNIKLHEFYFNMAGAAGDYSFSDFSPSAWSVQSPANNAAGSGSADFIFKASDPPPGPPVEVNNTVLLTFKMTKLTGNFVFDDFSTAATSVSNDTVLGEGQLGAHLQSLTVNSTTCPGGGCSDSGFAFGDYPDDPTVPPTQTPEPSLLGLLGLGLLGLAFSRRRRIVA